MLDNISGWSILLSTWIDILLIAVQSRVVSDLNCHKYEYTQIHVSVWYLFGGYMATDMGLASSYFDSILDCFLRYLERGL